MAENTISIEQVKKVARLANLDIKGDEQRFTELLSDTLNYVQILNELDTSKVKETYQVTGLEDVFQKKGQNTETLSKEEALSNADKVDNGLFSTKPVFER